MPQLEPTYLRYIYDGLVKGSIHPENAAELPEGLIGLYEEAFDERTSVIERQKLLQRFAIWALLKKEVSAAFVAEVLGDTEDEIQNFISTYSAWFNSPESGKYQLYHERLKVYLLQKLSEGEVAKLNALILDVLERKVNEEKVSESVKYCFELLSFHLFLNSYLSGNSNLLANYCLNDKFKNKQFEISGYYDWEEKMMAFGVEYFSLKQDQICHQIVFEKTKIQHKKKDIDLIISLLKRDKFELLFSLFKSLYEKELEQRVATAYLYHLTFFEIFELENKSFILKKEIANQLLETFEEYFTWDRGYYLAQFIDVNISFRLHCFFEQFGLDYKKIAILSSDQNTEYYGLDIRYADLKFIDPKHKEEAISILQLFKIFDYGISYVEKSKIVDLVDELTKYPINNKQNAFRSHLQKKLESIGKTKLLKQNDFIEIVENEVHSFNDLILSIKFILGINELTHNLKREASWLFQKTLLEQANGKLEFSGYWHRNDLKIIKSDNKINSDQIQILDLLTAESFGSMDPKSRFDALNKVVFSEELEVEILLAFVDLSLFFDGFENNDILDFFSSLFVEFILDTDEEKIMLYASKLFDTLANMEHHSEEFEDKIFDITINFFKSNDFNGYSKSTLLNYQENILTLYFDFNFYKYSFKQGIALINLFNQYQIDFHEEEIVERILEDLNYLIEENDYNEMWVIENSKIDQIYSKSYFSDFYDCVKRIQIEQVRISMSEFIFTDIISTKGLNQATLEFFKSNRDDFPGMYLWAKKALSNMLSITVQEKSYLPIIESNEFLLERLLLNIVATRENLKNDLNIQILKYYGLEWMIELDNEYENLISEK